MFTFFALVGVSEKNIMCIFLSLLYAIFMALVFQTVHIHFTFAFRCGIYGAGISGGLLNMQQAQSWERHGDDI